VAAAATILYGAGASLAPLASLASADANASLIRTSSSHSRTEGQERSYRQFGTLVSLAARNVYGTPIPNREFKVKL
jgi:hypothetical protein